MQCKFARKKSNVSKLNPNWHEVGHFPSLVFLIRFLAAESYQKFPNFIGGNEIRDEERQPMTSQYGHGDLSIFFWW